MSKAKMEAAREFIKEKRYSEARAILRTVDHPAARSWLIKLDEIDSPRTPITDEDPFGPPVTAPKRSRRRLHAWATVLILIVLIAVGVLAWRQYSASVTPMQLQSKLVIEDLDYKSNFCTTYCNAIKGNSACFTSCLTTPVWYMRGTKTPAP